MDIHNRIAGKTVAAVLTNGHILQIRCHDGSEINIVWLDDNGVPMKGKPVAAQCGVRIVAAGLSDIAHLPQVQQRGHA